MNRFLGLKKDPLVGIASAAGRGSIGTLTSLNRETAFNESSPPFRRTRTGLDSTVLGQREPSFFVLLFSDIWDGVPDWMLFNGFARGK